MRVSAFITSALIAVSVAGCASNKEPELVMRSATSDASDLTVLQMQADTLTVMTRDVMRRSTAGGAALGAVAGCALSVISASSAQNCIAAAAAGAAIGAVAGNAHGERSIARRVEIVDPNALVRTIRKSNDQIALLEMTLPDLLAEQDIELADLSKMVTRGELTEAAFAQRADAIREDRARIAEALSLSAAQATTAHENLKDAAARGQTGLDWHISATGHMARDVMSARSIVDLLG